jgi:hypothetical protein
VARIEKKLKLLPMTPQRCNEKVTKKHKKKFTVQRDKKRKCRKADVTAVSDEHADESDESDEESELEKESTRLLKRKDQREDAWMQSNLVRLQTTAKLERESKKMGRRTIVLCPFQKLLLWRLMLQIPWPVFRVQSSS